MRRLALCLAVLFTLAIPAISHAEVDLSGTWTLEITRVDQSGNVASVTTTMVLQKGTSRGFYYGTVTTEAPFITVVQERGKIQFTISCTNESTTGCGAAPGGYRSRTWGTGTAGKNRINVTWSDDIGLTGIGEAVRQ